MKSTPKQIVVTDHRILEIFNVAHSLEKVGDQYRIYRRGDPGLMPRALIIEGRKFQILNP